MFSKSVRVSECRFHSQSFRQPDPSDSPGAGTRSWHVLLSFLAAVLLACSGADAVTGPSETEAPKAVEVRVTPPEMTLTEGETGDFEATPRDAEGNAVSGYAISWSSSDPDVVSVDDGGTVTVHRAGTATIEATASRGGGSVSGSARVKGDRFLGSLAIEVSGVELVESDERGIEVSVTDEEGNPVDRAVTWTSSDEAVATVSSEGVVTGRGPGTANIEARIGDATDAVEVAVFRDDVASLAVRPAFRMVAKGEGIQLEVEVKDEKGQLVEHPVRWVSDDTSVARVDSSGQVVTLRAGNAQITATARGTSTKDGSLVTVGTVPQPTLEISPSEASVGVAVTVKVQATLKDSEGEEMSTDDVQWTSTDPTVATVDSDGMVTGESGGHVSIVAAMPDHPSVTDTASVTVQAQVTEVAVSPASLELIVGETDTLSAEAFDAGGNTLEKEIAWRSADDGVASVNRTGVVTAVAVGTVLVVADYEGVADTAEITVSSSSETTSSDTTSPPPIPSELSLWEASRTDTDVTYSTSWSSSDGADSYSWTAGSNGGLWNKSGSDVSELGVSFTAPRSESDDDSFFCVRAVNEHGESEQRCTGFTVPAESTTSSDSDTTDDGAGTSFTEDFSSYASTADMLADPRDVFLDAEDTNTKNITLDTSMGYGTSTQSMRYTFPAPADRSGDVCQEYTIRRGLDFRKSNVLGSTVKEVWVEVWAKFEDGFDTAWPNFGRATVDSIFGTFEIGEYITFSNQSSRARLKRIEDNGDGTRTFWWNNNQDPARGEVVSGQTSGASATVISERLGCNANSDYKFVFGNVFPGSTGRFGFNVGNGLNRSYLFEGPAGDNADHVCSDNIRGRESDDGALECEFTGPSLWQLDVWDGKWHRFRFHWKLPSDPGTTNDGEIHIWVDSEKFAEVVDLDTDADKIWGLMLGINLGRPGQEQSLWWGKVSVWSESPGW